jgi:formylglycine-generating enzyme required for sulfatase activity
MGSPPGEPRRNDDEEPQRKITISEPFLVGKYEVTFAEWDACVAAGGCGTKPSDEGWGRGDRPAINVSWNDAEEFVGWLSKKTRRTYRLLSEAEWEYVARAGTTSAY